MMCFLSLPLQRSSWLPGALGEWLSFPEEHAHYLAAPNNVRTLGIQLRGAGVAGRRCLKPQEGSDAFLSLKGTTLEETLSGKSPLLCHDELGTGMRHGLF